VNLLVLKLTYLKIVVYLLFPFYSSHPIFKVAPFKKIHDGIIKLLERLFSDREKSAIQIMKNGLNKDALSYDVLAFVTIQKLLVNNELADDDKRNTITKIYHYSNNRIMPNEGANGISIKHINNAEDDSGESESVLESFRTTSELPVGSLVEFKVVFSNILYLAQQLNVQADIETINDFKNMFMKFKEYLPIDNSIYLVSWLYKDIIDPRAFDHLELDELINAFTIAYIYLMENGYKTIALIISSFAADSSEIRLNFSLRNKLNPDIREKLNELFPINKTIANVDDITSSSFIEETITLISKEIMGSNLVSVLSEEHLKEVNVGKRQISIDESIKNTLAEYIIFVNERK